MPLLLWDASALVKRYALETGSDTVDALFDAVQPTQMLTTLWGYAETYAVLVRMRNADRLSTTLFTAAVAGLQREIITAGDFGLLSIDDEIVLAALTYIATHNLNTADAAILATFMEYMRRLPPSSPPCLLVAADQRLLRAAGAEGLRTLDPEHVPAAEVPTFLASAGP